MVDKKMDDFMRRLFKEQTDHVEASTELKQRIDQKINEQKGVMNMKKQNMKKWIAAAACICLLAPTMLYAGGKITTYVSSTNAKDYIESTSWNDLSKLEKKTGLDVDLPKDFSNGYEFKKMETMSIDGKDDAGNTMSSTKELTVTYENAEENKVECNMNQVTSEEESGLTTPVQERKINGIVVRYYNDTYKFVPGDYKETAEDKAMQEKDNFYLSYGSDEVEIKHYSYVKWEKDGVSYLLGGFDNGLSGEELIQMAAEIIE